MNQNLNVVYICNIDLNNLKNKNIKLVNDNKSNENNLKKLKQEKKLSKQLPYQLPNSKIKVAMAFTTTSLSNYCFFSNHKTSAYINSCFTVINKYQIKKKVPQWNTYNFLHNKYYLL
jgi:hypothetical protein